MDRWGLWGLLDSRSLGHNDHKVHRASLVRLAQPEPRAILGLREMQEEILGSLDAQGL